MRRHKPVCEVGSLFAPLQQVLKNVKFKAGAPLQDAQVRQSIAEAEAMLGNGGRLVIRPSGTEPVIRVMAEGDDETLVHRIVDDLCGAIAKAAA